MQRASERASERETETGNVKVKEGGERNLQLKKKRKKKVVIDVRDDAAVRE